jgi:hypothetical protein
MFFNKNRNGKARAVNLREVNGSMEAIVLSATLVGSLGTAYVIQRAILGLCLKAINITRRGE